MTVCFDMAFREEIKSCVVTIGNFDGVHLAHQELIKSCVKKAKERNIPSVLITFNPHPSELFSKKPILPLLTLDERLKRIEDLGIDYTYVLPFTHEFAKQKAADFVQNFLENSLHCKEVVIGYNFLMGSDKVDTTVLRNLLKTFDCELTVQEQILFHDKQEDILLSSSSIRKNLEQGNIERVNAMLGREHCITGLVEDGAKRGSSKLGFPTANIDTGKLLLPRAGVYATSVSFPDRKNSKIYKSISNIGYNPTFFGEKLVLESYILDFSEMIYGERLQVSFIQYMRDERKFDSIQELIHQLEKDKNFREKL